MPDTNRRYLVAGYGKLGTKEYSTAAAAKDGSLVIAYLAGGAPTKLTFDLARISRPLNGFWFDPTSGTSNRISNSLLRHEEKKSLEPGEQNASGDSYWVLVLATEMNKHQTEIK